MKDTPNQYHPDLVSPPGETLRETLEALGMAQSELAERMGRPKKTINEIIKGKAALTPDTALQLERVLGIPAAFWNRRDFHHREFVARQQEIARLKSQTGWLEDLPVKDMVKLGWIRPQADKVRQIQEILNFFGVVSPEQWKQIWCGPRVAFRRSHAFRNDPALLAGWLRMGEVQARKLECAPYKASLFAKSLRGLRALTLKPHQQYARQMVETCADAGVALVLLPEPPRISISGATRWITNRKALIQISLRYTTNDQFWLTFFHEAGHILLHGKRDIFLESGGSSRSKEEAADSYAWNFLVPQARLARFLAEGPITRESVVALSREIELAPGVLVGLLQHKGVLPNSHLNDLKKLFKLEAP